MIETKSLLFLKLNGTDKSELYSTEMRVVNHNKLD